MHSTHVEFCIISSLVTSLFKGEKMNCEGYTNNLPAKPYLPQSKLNKFKHMTINDVTEIKTEHLYPILRTFGAN
jgi:hypothetical protein